MAVTTKHGVYGVVIDSTLLGGITNLNTRTGSEVRNEPTSGEIYARFQSLVAQLPGAEFTTLNIAAALDLCALTGVDVGGLAAGLNLYAQKHVEGGTRAGAASHRKYTLKDGILVPRTLSVTHQGDATLRYEAVGIWDGSNDVITISDSQSLPGGLTDAERFTLGPVTIESVSLAQVRAFELDFGLEVVSEGSDSDIWDTFISIASIQPQITLRGIDMEWFKAANIPLLGKAVTHTNTAIYLRKRAAGGSFVIDGTAEHIKFTAAGLATIDTPFDADGNEAGETSLVVPLKYDGTNAPLVIDTTSAIT